MYIGLAAEGDVILSTKDFVKILSSEHETTLHDFNENRLFLGKLKIL